MTRKSEELLYFTANPRREAAPRSLVFYFISILRIEFCYGSSNTNRGSPEQSVCNISEAGVNYLTVTARSPGHSLNVRSVTASFAATFCHK